MRAAGAAREFEAANRKWTDYCGAEIGTDAFRGFENVTAATPGHERTRSNSSVRAGAESKQSGGGQG